MTGHTSHNALPRDPSSVATRSRYAVLCLLSGLVVVATVRRAVDKFPDTELGRRDARFRAGHWKEKVV